MNKISINELTKYFVDKAVLNGLSFNVQPNSSTVLLGKSGSGKSTFLRCMAQLEQPNSGSIFINQQNIATCPDLLKKIGMVFQQLHLWQHMTVLENLILAPVHVLKLSKAVAIEKAKHLLQQLDLENKYQKYPKELSLGEQQRTAIARALMMDPEILLFDEPTASLDPERSTNIANIIKTLVNKGVTFITATHDINFAKEIATQIIFLENGRVLETVPVENKTISPNTTRFLQFLNTYSTSN